MLSNKWGLVSFVQRWAEAQPGQCRRTVVVRGAEGVVGHPPAWGEYDKVSECHASTGRLGCQDGEDGRILEKSKAKKNEMEQGSDLSAQVTRVVKLTDTASPWPKHFCHLHLITWMRCGTLGNSTQFHAVNRGWEMGLDGSSFEQLWQSFPSWPS